MERRDNLCTRNLLILHLFFQYLCPDHYVSEIIHYIIYLYHQLFPIKIAWGSDHTMILFDGKIYAWGNNYYGQLGIGRFGSRRERIDIPTLVCIPIKLNNVTKIECGTFHSMALTKSGHLYTWGSNEYGQLGIGLQPKRKYHSRHGPRTDDSHCIPTLISPIYFDSPIKKLIAGNSYSMVITELGSAYFWGKNIFHSHSQNIYSPEKLDCKSIKKAISGAYHVLALDHYNNLLCWGLNNRYGPVLKHSGSEFIKTIACSNVYSAIIIDTDIYFAGNFYHTDTILPDKISFNGLKKIACGNQHFLILDTGGNVYAQGNNGSGYLGLGHNDPTDSLEKLKLNNIKKIICTLYTSYAISNSNEIWVWGMYYTNTPTKFTF